MCVHGLTFVLVSRHRPGSASGVLLSKWLGESGADVMASMVGSESMTSSDWMLLALSSVGQDSQRKVGEAFVQRLLEKNDIHPAAAILLGLGDSAEAIEVYYSRAYYMEAVLLACLTTPNDWPHQSRIVRKLGETAVMQGQAELAARCFSCTGIESGDAPGAAQPAQKVPEILSPPLSPPSAGSVTGSIPGRMSVKNSALKLITDFGDKNAPGPRLLSTDNTPVVGAGVTPIAESALSPGGAGGWYRPSVRGGRDVTSRDPSSARTATPGAYKRRRLPSRGTSNLETPVESTPLASIIRSTGGDKLDQRSRTRSRATSISGVSTDASARPSEPVTVLSAAKFDPERNPNRNSRDSLPSPSQGMMAALQKGTRVRNGSRGRIPEGLHLQVTETVEDGLSSGYSGAPSASGSEMLTGGILSSTLSASGTEASTYSMKGKSMDRFINSLEHANYNQRQQRSDRSTRAPSRESKSRARARDTSEVRGGAGPRVIKPAKRSPSSPAPMSPEEADHYRKSEQYDDERYYSLASPAGSRNERARSRSNVRGASRVRSASKASRRAESPSRGNARSGSRVGDRVISRSASRQASPDRAGPNDRGRSQQRYDHSGRRSPSSPLPMGPEGEQPKPEGNAEDAYVDAGRQRHRSTSRRPGGRAASTRREPSPDGQKSRQSSRPAVARARTDTTGSSYALSRKEQAARELEQRRLSLVRRPSAPAIPLPSDLQKIPRPPLANRSVTDLTDYSASYLGPDADMHGFTNSRSQSVEPEMAMRYNEIQRSQTADPEAMMRYAPKMNTGTSTSSVPIGLPATPRAMRHPRYMSTDPNERDAIPAVPQIPDNAQQLSPVSYTAAQPDSDAIAPLLPSTVYGQRMQQAPPRAASAPPKHDVPIMLPSHTFKSKNASGSRRHSGGRTGQIRRVSPTDIPGSVTVTQPSITASIDETLHDSHVVIVPEAAPPPLLPELQHLAGPPPPPPPPTMFSNNQPNQGGLGVINITMDDQKQNVHVVDVSNTPASVSLPSASRATSPPVSQLSHRRGRGSISSEAGSTGLGSRIRNAAERMRSSSRSRAISPPLESFNRHLPYESFPPPMTRDNLALHEKNYMPAGSNNGQMPPPPPPVPPMPAGGSSGLVEHVIPPDNASNQGKRGTPFSGYRHPKEVRANMPPDQLQSGVVQPVEAGMI